MIHYFNPGHETAVLNASKHYHPPVQVAKMQSDLAFLPAGYASPGDYVYMENPLPDDFIRSCEPLNLQVKPATPGDFSCNPEVFQHSEVDLWGISPQSIHFFEQLSAQGKLSLVIPRWKEELRFWGSRFASQQLLAGLLESVPGIEPDILPQFVSTIEAVERQTVQSHDRLLVKSPYSSSGRGLIWLPPGKLAQSEKQIITGMLNRQKQVSIERALDKQLDFSMQFEITPSGNTLFAGFSIFRTNDKGAYEKSLLDSQERLEKQIASLIGRDLLFYTQRTLTGMIQEKIAPHYSGIAGVDMLLYKSGSACRLHPCVEINLRKNMGYLAVRLAEKHLHPEAQGEFTVGYNREPQATVQKHLQLQKQHPLLIKGGRIRSGYLSLCPVTDSTNCQAYIVAQ